MTSAALPTFALESSNGFRISLFSTKDGDRRPVSIAYSDIDHLNGDSAGEGQESAVPSHPIPYMQDAFAESLDEVTHGGAENKPKLREQDATERRKRLLDQAKDAKPWDNLWRYRPGQTQHESIKLISQISFGVYLLLNGMANDNDQVINILQGHIDEVDEFLEVTLEDLAEAKTDLTQRTEHLKLPLRNMQTFESLLEDRQYRAEILEGNERIEHVIERMEKAEEMWDDDIDSGRKCSIAFSEWLKEQDHAAWREDHPELEDIYNAMRGNGEGWLNAFDEMEKRVDAANELAVQLANIVTEIETTAGEVSRKTAMKVQPYSSPNGSIKSPSSRSNSRSAHASVLSGTTSVALPFRIASVNEEEFEDYDLPGGAPLLPPSRYTGRVHSTSSTPQLSVNTAVQSPPSQEEDLFILQPKTYTPNTPKGPEPIPSPLLRPSPSMPALDKRTSLRQRISLKAAPPGAIQVPPPRHSTASRATSNQLSPTYSSPPLTGNSQIRDSAYGSDAENQYRQSHRIASYNEPSAPVRPSLRPAPNSEQQVFRPMVPPGSPLQLQQRPHTAYPENGTQRGSQFSPPRHLRNQPSRLGGMSMLSTGEQGNGSRPVTPSGNGAVHDGQQGLKKKKSAFGWFKKAFTMDDDERAAFESRRQMQVEGKYYSSNGQKFLDGRRLR